MKDNCTYLLKLLGQVSEGEINSLSPVQMTVKEVEADGAVWSICSDQSGLVGLLSTLHGMGFVFLSLSRIDLAGLEEPEPGQKVSSLTLRPA